LSGGPINPEETVIQIMGGLEWLRGNSLSNTALYFADETKARARWPVSFIAAEFFSKPVEVAGAGHRYPVAHALAGQVARLQTD